MGTFETVYAHLNPAQRTAVDTIYGPLLVLAGPGTGKTQLLSARVAHILQTTDALPQNILCLTFTESGARNMRDRLSAFIGRAAYDVQISTYHGFGSTIIGRFPEYFTGLRLERPVDELGKRQILADILESTDYRSPIKQARYHLGDLVSTISEVKRGLLTAPDLRAIAQANRAAIAATQADIARALQPHAKLLPRKISTALPLFDTIASTLASYNPEHNRALSAIKPLANMAANELHEATQTAQEEGKTTPLTAWKNKWLVKNGHNDYMLAGGLEAGRLEGLADTLEQYQARLAARGLYDFDDMILQAITVLQDNDELRFTLQEQYQFVLLDEFQDTNAAQLQLVRLLTDNPVHEDKPNVLAVGDDDQAIYAFQGAEVSNMLDFYHMYRDVTVLSLTDNYRSQTAIIHTAGQVAEQITGRLHRQFSGVSKKLTAASKPEEVSVARRSYRSPVAEHTAIARQITKLIEGGTAASTIAVLAPKHKYLEPLVPYLQAQDVPVAYEKRENILQAPVIRQLLTMSRLILALQTGNHPLADSLWPEVLSYDFWDFSTSDIWRISWQASDHHKTWSELLLDKTEFRHAALLMLTLAGSVATEPLENMLDALLGTSDVQTHDRSLPSVRSPLREYYLGRSDAAVTLYETVTQLTVLRARLREHQASEAKVLQLPDLLAFVAAYEAAEQPMLNTSPYSQSADAVQLMTVFKAKGLEFDHVFLLACDDSVWGSRASGIGNKLTLPANLVHIRHAGSTDDERLRLLYVAITRARRGLYLTSHHQTYSGRTTEPVKYFDETAGADGHYYSRILPQMSQLVIQDDTDPPSLEALAAHWRQRHLAPQTPLTELLRERLAGYRLSPTHATHFIDLEYGGPASFLLNTLLRFPSAPSPDAAFGNAIHNALQWAQGELNKTGQLPPAATVTAHAQAYLAREPLTAGQKAVQSERAAHTLTTYLAAPGGRLHAGNIAEKSFRDEGVFSGDVRLGGTIDLLEIDQKTRSITVVDYKTGRLGNNPLKLHRYTLQLYCYQLLIEGSHTYRGYSVRQGRLVFVEPDDNGNIIEKHVSFETEELERVRQLLTAIWHCIMELNIPDTAAYAATLQGVRAFEDHLIARYGPGSGAT